MRRLVRPAFVAACALGIVACGDVPSAGVAASRAGRDAEAHAIFSAALAARGDDASPELRYGLAATAWAVGRGAEAVEVARAAEEAAGGQGPVASAAAWVRGLVAMAAAREARSPDRSRADAEDALAAFRAACRAGSDDPALRRNLERALLLLDDLAERRGEPRPRPAPPPPPEPLPSAAPETPAAVREDLLDEKERARLFERLAARDAEMRRLRLERQAPVVEGEGGTIAR